MVGRWVKNHQDVIYGRSFIQYTTVFTLNNLPAHNFKSDAKLIFELRSLQNAKSIHGLISNFNDHLILKCVFQTCVQNKSLGIS